MEGCAWSALSASGRLQDPTFLSWATVSTQSILVEAEQGKKKKRKQKKEK